MKKTGLTLLALTFSILTFAGQKIDIKFSGKSIENSIKRKLCVVKDDVLSISGDTAAKNNAWRGVALDLPFKSPAGKKFVFSGEVKGKNIQGEFWVAIRLIKAGDKSLKYEVHKITKDQDWKNFSKTFTASAKTVKMQLYILARNLANESIGSVKNLTIEQL